MNEIVSEMLVSLKRLRSVIAEAFSRTFVPEEGDVIYRDGRAKEEPFIVLSVTPRYITVIPVGGEEEEFAHEHPEWRGSAAYVSPGGEAYMHRRDVPKRFTKRATVDWDTEEVTDVPDLEQLHIVAGENLPRSNLRGDEWSSKPRR